MLHLNRLLDLQNRIVEIKLDMERLNRLGLSETVYKREFDILSHTLQIVKDQIEEHKYRG